MADSSSFGSSQSTSTPTFQETPENSIIDQLSSYARQIAGQMQNWANQTYAQTSSITNQAVGNFFNVSQKMLGLSGNMTDQYNNLFAPENAQLVADANSYASPARMAVDMGQAGATQAQAGDQALKNSEEALRSYGINPSDGRYAALDKAAAVQNAANIAGAENTQRNADIDRGQRLRSEAVRVGAQLPAAISNANNTAIQANTGASNASLANANTGRNLQSLPNDYLKTAMDVKLPPTGQNQQSTQQNQSRGSSPDPQQRGGGNGNGNGNGNGAGSPSGPAWMPQHGGADGKSGPAIQSYRPPGKPAGPTSDPNDFWNNESQKIGDIYKDMPTTETMPPEWRPQETGQMTIGQPGGNENIWNNPQGTGFGDGNPFDDGGFGQTYNGGQDQTFGGMGGGTDTEWGNISYDPAGNNQGAASDWGSTYDQPNPNTDWGSGADQYSNSSYGDYTPPSDNYDMGGAYADGGPIPPSASPSGGAQTDDIAAQGPQGQPMRMNADEFVIPQDVARWKGQEFFQNLIDQSRKKRMGASAQPQRTPMR